MLSSLFILIGLSVAFISINIMLNINENSRRNIEATVFINENEDQIRELIAKHKKDAVSILKNEKENSLFSDNDVN